MELAIFTHHMELTPRLENYVAKKTERLDRYMPNLSEIRVDLTEQNARSALERQIAQITIRDNRGTILRAEERSNDMFASIDAVIDKIYRQISAIGVSSAAVGALLAKRSILANRCL